ncbi:MAG: hypothetical protein K6F20_10880 [Bacteroidaceae bacterium]|nr:hypothetical protein [Bacteroidaceae bacterium]
MRKLNDDVFYVASPTTYVARPTTCVARLATYVARPATKNIQPGENLLMPRALFFPLGSLMKRGGRLSLPAITFIFFSLNRNFEA